MSKPWYEDEDVLFRHTCCYSEADFKATIRRIKAEAWNVGYAARASEGHLSPGESNPYREETT